MVKNNKIFLICEIGINHNGNMNYAKKMISAAAEAGADAVKFQLFKPGDLYLKSNSNYKNLSKFSLNYREILLLKKYCDRKKITFLCTPFSIEAFLYLKKLKLKMIKIASMDFNNFELIDTILKHRKKILISIGMGSPEEVNKFKKKYTSKLKNFLIMHCISNYPTKIKDINLQTIMSLKKKFPKNKIGLSDHTVGIDAMKSSLFYGVSIIEKHFTLNKKMKGPDHSLSADKKDILSFRSFEKNYFLSRGKDLLNSNNERPDKKNLKNFKRGIYFANNFSIYMLFSKNMIKCVRPYNGVSLEDAKKAQGKKLKKSVVIDENFKLNLFI